MEFLDFLYFDEIISYAVILHLSGENSGRLLFIVLLVSGVCIFIVL